MEFPHIFLQVQHIQKETEDTASFTLERTDGLPLPYQSGQFLTLIFRHLHGEEIRRSYSISSSPLADEKLIITVKRIANGEVSRRLFDQTREGNLLESMGASGLFTLPSPETWAESPFCFFAAGSGITPIFSQIKTLLYGSRQKILLIYSNRNPMSTIFLEELIRLQSIFPDRFQIEWLYSESPLILESRLTQYVMDHLAEKYALYQQNYFFYVCGPSAYMRMIEIKLRSEGMNAERIKKELFVIYTPPLNLNQPPDTQAHRVTLHGQQEQVEFLVQYPESILAAAKKNGISLPYSCENGQCGSCALRCLSGEVWMRYNEVLGEKALKAGYVLTCTGYPVHGPVELVL